MGLFFEKRDRVLTFKECINDPGFWKFLSSSIMIFGLLIALMLLVSGCKESEIEPINWPVIEIEKDQIKAVRKIEYRNDGWMAIWSEEEAFPGIICTVNQGCLDRRAQSHELYLKLKKK